MTNKKNNIGKGFLFGITLQIAVGPVCLFILSTASIQGFLNAEVGVIGVTLIDGLYIVSAIMGFSKLLNTSWSKKYLGYFGVTVLALFGIKMIFDSIHNFDLSFSNSMVTGNFLKTFLTVLVLTGSNPLTIIFWTGVFSSRIGSRADNKESVFYFSIGCILSTVIFLSTVAFIGSVLSLTMPIKFILILNATVGGGLLLFAGFRLAKIIN
jgi:threonine/homoserine/homoserine lactone efflux protein